ncbi:unnamed protein product, partial [Ranitomeya imitator]
LLLTRNLHNTKYTRCYRILQAGCPIVSSTDSILSLLAITLEKILTPLTKLSKFIKTLGPLPSSAILTTWDMSSLYAAITHVKGMRTTDYRLLAEAGTEPKIRQFCSDLLGLVLKENYFMLQDTFYIQRQGIAMGSNVAPSFAVAYMVAFKEDHVFNHPSFQQHSIIWWRFIDDIFCIWSGPVGTLLLFDIHINNVWPELKFTLQYSTEISFLDTMIHKSTEGELSIDL